ncbi:MAG: hypothetical protein EXR27_19805 [Betaproteobacteria bacterium]|nr:hypothetical protein [Betaproteobacteria bacterium]
MDNIRQDLYKIIDMPRDAGREALEQACLRLVEKYRPENNPGDLYAATTFAQVEDAYLTLTDPGRRAAYDREYPDASGTASGDALPGDARLAGIAPAKHRAPPQIALPSTALRVAAAVLMMTGVAALGYYLYANHSSGKATPDGSTPRFVESKRLETSNPGPFSGGNATPAGTAPKFVESKRLETSNPGPFYITVEKGGPALRLKPETSSRLKSVTSSAQVVMFATSWCPYCAAARTLFKKRGVVYTELDVERDAQAKYFQEKVLQQNGYPTIVIGNRVIVGFSEPGILASLKEL